MKLRYIAGILLIICLVLMGVIYWQHTRNAVAQRDTAHQQSAAQLTPSPVDPIWERGVAAQAQGKLSDARSSFIEVVTNFPNSSVAPSAKARLADIDSKLEAAAEERRKANYTESQPTVSGQVENERASNAQPPTQRDYVNSSQLVVLEMTRRVQQDLRSVAPTDAEKEYLSKKTAFDQYNQRKWTKIMTVFASDDLWSIPEALQMFIRYSGKYASMIRQEPVNLIELRIEMLGVEAIEVKYDKDVALLKAKGIIN